MSNFDEHNEIDEHVLKTLLYFDIFNYPLTREEVFNFLGKRTATPSEVGDSLRRLGIQNIIYNFDGFYTVQNRHDLVIRRLKGNRMAENAIPIAKKQAAKIGGFPFVRAVLASGSLSKNYMDENSDLDFFIITSPGRLWIARLFLALYKRLFLFNSHKNFCTNYFVDETHLEIEEQNLFTATELGTVIPLYNAELYERLLLANTWVKNYLPNIKVHSAQIAVRSQRTGLKRIMEWAFNFDWLDDFFRKVTFHRWKRIYGNKMSGADFGIAFKTKKSVSKNHPRQYQKKVMEMYNHKVIEFNTRHSMLYNDK